MLGQVTSKIVLGVFIGGLTFAGNFLSPTAAEAAKALKECRKDPHNHGGLICRCYVVDRQLLVVKPKDFTSIAAYCSIGSSGTATAIVSSSVPPSKLAPGSSSASNSSSVLSVGAGTSFGISGGAVLSNSTSTAGASGSNSANAGGGTSGNAGGFGTNNFTSGGANGKTISGAKAN